MLQERYEACTEDVSMTRAVDSRVRCDKCGVQAYVRASITQWTAKGFIDTSLEFCGHHYEQYQIHFMEWDVDDRRDALTKRLNPVVSK